MKTTSFSASDETFLRAAQEHLKAGCPLEAEAELAKLSSESGQHPDVLEARWEICAQTGNWERALEVAGRLSEVQTETEAGWLYQACSLNELKRTQAAFDVLMEGSRRFPKVPTIPYNLACCACKLGQLKDASFWLGKAVELGGRTEIKLMALDDADLAPLLDQICAM